MTKFSLFQTKRICRQQFKYDENGRNGRKQCGKRRNQTSILEVLHGNTKSPTGCMYTLGAMKLQLDVKVMMIVLHPKISSISASH